MKQLVLQYSLILMLMMPLLSEILDLILMQKYMVIIFLNLNWKCTFVLYIFGGEILLYRQWWKPFFGKDASIPKK